MIKTIPAYRPIPSASDSPDSSPEKKAEHHRLSSQGGSGPSHHHPHRPPNPHNLQHRQLQQRERHELQQRRETGKVWVFWEGHKIWKNLRRTFDKSVVFQKSHPWTILCLNFKNSGDFLC